MRVKEKSYWVARSRTVHCHLALPVLRWNLRPLFSRVDLRASVWEGILEEGCVSVLVLDG